MFSLSDELINVPLIVSHPSLTPGRRSDVVSHVDLAPTVYDLLDREDINVPVDISSLPGRSLFDDPNLDENRIVFSEYGPPGPQLNALFNNADRVPEGVVEDVSRHIRAAVTQEHKYLRYDDGEERLYRRTDETTDVIDDYPEVYDRLSTAMDDTLNEPTTVELNNLDAYVESDVIDQLEHLGYV
jgi:arylsulfatase A-like enzyme